MKFRAAIKKADNWWIGWLIDIPGVNAQERTKDELLESLKIGVEDMLKTELDLPSGGELAMVNVPLISSISY